MTGRLPVVVALGPVDPALVTGVLDGHCRFVPDPGDVRCTDLGDLAGRSDVITLHLPLTGQTRHLVGDAFLARVKPGAVLVNCSRGASSTLMPSGGPSPPGLCPGSGSTYSTPSRPAHTRCTTTRTSSSPRT